jgi:hypothetical protein
MGTRTAEQRLVRTLRGVLNRHGYTLHGSMSGRDRGTRYDVGVPDLVEIELVACDLSLDDARRWTVEHCPTITRGSTRSIVLAVPEAFRGGSREHLLAQGKDHVKRRAPRVRTGSLPSKLCATEVRTAESIAHRTRSSRRRSGGNWSAKWPIRPW